MAQQSPPYALQNASHSAALFRQALTSLLYQAGPLDSASYVVSAQTTPNMSIQVNGGTAWVPGSQVASIPGTYISTQGGYFALNDAAVTLTITASDPTNPRIDVVYVAVNDQQYSGTLNTAVLGVATGTPAGSPVAPALPANALALAQVRVNATVTTITNANITGTSTGNATSSGGLVVGTPITCTSTTRPSLGIRMGQLIYETDTGLAWQWTGAAWKLQTGTVSCSFSGSASTPAGVVTQAGAVTVANAKGGAWAATTNGITVPMDGQYLITVNINCTTATFGSGRNFVEVICPAVGVRAAIASPGETGGQVTASIPVAAGTAVTWDWFLQMSATATVTYGGYITRIGDKAA